MTHYQSPLRKRKQVGIKAEQRADTKHDFLSCWQPMETGRCMHSKLLRLHNWFLLTSSQLVYGSRQCDVVPSRLPDTQKSCCVLGLCSILVGIFNTAAAPIQVKIGVHGGMDGSGTVFHKPFANMINANNAPFLLHDVMSKRCGGRGERTCRRRPRDGFATLSVAEWRERRCDLSMHTTTTTLASLLQSWSCSPVTDPELCDRRSYPPINCSYVTAVLYDRMYFLPAASAAASLHLTFK